MALSSCISMLRAATSKSAQMDDGDEDGDGDGATQPSGGDGAAAAATAGSAGVCSVNVNGLKLVSLDVQCGGGGAGPTVYTLVAQGNADESDAFLATYLTDVRDLIRAYFGGPPLAAALPDDGGALSTIAVSLSTHRHCGATLGPAQRHGHKQPTVQSALTHCSVSFILSSALIVRLSFGIASSRT